MDLTITVGSIFISLVIAFPLFYYLIYEPLRIFIRWMRHVFFTRLEIYKAEYLSKNFIFYRGLKPELQLRFEKRIASFLRNKKFKGVDVEVTDEMKLFVAGCAIQLTFGLRNFWLTEFDNIQLHKDSYFLRDHEYKTMGHVSGMGIISLSINDLHEGFADPADGINVGLHEMAHALYISSVKKGWNLNFAVEYDQWEREAVIEWKKEEAKGQYVLRDYAYGNIYEFFAVSVEYFFEKSVGFQMAAPNLYMEIERLLRLDPMNHEDPILTHLPVLYPSQPIPLPAYRPFDLIKMIFESGKNFFCFLAGSVFWYIGIIEIFRAIQFDWWYPNYPNPFLGNIKLSGLLFFIGVCFYIQVFYREKSTKQK